MLYLSHKTHLLLKFVEIDEVSINLLQNTINWIAKNLKISRNFNFTSDVSAHAIKTCQGVFVPVPAFLDYFGLLFQHIVPSINSNLQLFI